MLIMQIIKNIQNKPALYKQSTPNKVTRHLTRYLVMLHRYIGLVFSFIILLWCISGFVMMFIQYPSLSSQEHDTYLDRLILESCCKLPALSSINPTRFDSFTIRQKPNGPQLILSADNQHFYFDATTGKPQIKSTPETRLAYANQIASVLGLSEAQSVATVNIDQWSVLPSVAIHAPFEIFKINDLQSSHLYISRQTGELIQQVSLNERTWGWIGAVVHWIYPTMLRQNTELWVQLIIWLSITALFMVIFGITVGITRLRHKGEWRSSPYGGRYLWHHYTSLATGILMLTWLFSGLMSMYPWGLMEGRSFANERQNLTAPGFSLNQQFSSVLQNISTLDLSDNIIELKGVMIAGHLNIFSKSSNRNIKLIKRIKINNTDIENFPTVNELAKIMRPEVETLSIDSLQEGDYYYYNHHDKRVFPVYRIIYQDGDRIYLNSQTYEVEAVFDDGRKTARWLYLGLHRGDFFARLNTTPYWYLIWGGLLLLLTSAVLIGCWLAINRWKKIIRGRRKLYTN